MAGKRSDKLRRLVALQRHVEQMAQADLAETNRERDRLREAVEGTVDAMGSMNAAHRDFTRHYARRIASLTMKDHRLAGLAGVQEKRALGEGAKADRLADSMAEALTGEQRAEEEETLYDLLDQAGAGRPQASRKLHRP